MGRLVRPVRYSPGRLYAGRCSVCWVVRAARSRRLPIVSVRGDRNITETEVSQWRYVAGISGDLPALNVGSLYDWTFDLSVTHSMSSGEAHRMGIREDRLNLSLGAFSTTNTPCENDTGEVAGE